VVDLDRQLDLERFERPSVDRVISLGPIVELAVNLKPTSHFSLSQIGTSGSDNCTYG
jgi:hypothetical protein